MATKKSTSTSPKKKIAPKKRKIRSLRIEKETEPFMRFCITKDTIYWIVIAIISIVFISWIYTVQSDLNDLYRQVEKMRQQEEINRLQKPN